MDVSQLELGDDDSITPPIKSTSTPPKSPFQQPPVIPITTQSQFQSDKMKAAVSLMRKKQPPSALVSSSPPSTTTTTTTNTNTNSSTASSQPKRQREQEEDKEEEMIPMKKQQKQHEYGDDEIVASLAIAQQHQQQQQTRSIPGPAGALPKRAAGEPAVLPSQLNPSILNANKNVVGVTPIVDGVIVASKLSKSSKKRSSLSATSPNNNEQQKQIHQKPMITATTTTSAASPSTIVGQSLDESPEEFRSGAWVKMLKELKLVPFGNEKLHFSISYIIKEGFYRKVPKVIAIVSTMSSADINVKMTLRDPTGTIEAMVLRRALDSRPEIQVGCVVCLKKVSVFSPSPIRHTLNVVSDNIESVFTTELKDDEHCVIDDMNYSNLLYEDPPHEERPKMKSPVKQQVNNSPKKTPSKSKQLKPAKQQPQTQNQPPISQAAIKSTVTVKPPPIQQQTQQPIQSPQKVVTVVTPPQKLIPQTSVVIIPNQTQQQKSITTSPKPVVIITKPIINQTNQIKPSSPPPPSPPQQQQQKQKPNQKQQTLSTFKPAVIQQPKQQQIAGFSSRQNRTSIGGFHQQTQQQQSLEDPEETKQKLDQYLSTNGDDFQ